MTLARGLCTVRSRVPPPMLLLGLALVTTACVTVDTGAGPTRSGDALPDGPLVSADPVATAEPSVALPSSTSGIGGRSDSPSLGYISLDDSLPFSQAVATSVREAAAAAGIELVECDPGWSPDGVLACADEMGDAGVHVVISFQPFAELAEEVCTATAGAPTIGVVFEQGPCQVSRLVVDQAAAGRMAGRAVGTLAAERWECDVNAYVSLESNDADPDGRARMQGYREGYAEECELPELQLTLDDADRLATAEARVRAVLDKLNGRPNIIVGINESAVLGAMAAVRAGGRENQFWYSGQLADPAIRTEIACNERYIASVAQFPERFGAPLVAAALAAIEGREVPPVMKADLELVTAENVRELFPDTPTCDG